MIGLEERIMNYSMSRLSPKRFAHVERVIATLEEIAPATEASLPECRVAGWLHDCAKEESREMFLDLLAHGAIELDEETRDQPNLWHAYHAAFIGTHVFGIDSEDILQAVRYHPTGAPNLSAVGMTLFVADYAEPGRPMSWTREIREQAKEDLLGAALRVCREKIRYVTGKGREPHSRSLAFAEWLEAGAPVARV